MRLYRPGFHQIRPLGFFYVLDKKRLNLFLEKANI